MATKMPEACGIASHTSYSCNADKNNIKRYVYLRRAKCTNILDTISRWLVLVLASCCFVCSLSLGVFFAVTLCRTRCSPSFVWCGWKASSMYYWCVPAVGLSNPKYLKTQCHWIYSSCFFSTLLSFRGWQKLRSIPNHLDSFSVIYFFFTVPFVATALRYLVLSIGFPFFLFPLSHLHISQTHPILCEYITLMSNACHTLSFACTLIHAHILRTQYSKYL